MPNAHFVQLIHSRRDRPDLRRRDATYLENAIEDFPVIELGIINVWLHSLCIRYTYFHSELSNV
jgi:hypothetical protein